MSAQPNSSQWFILRGEMKYGPYQYGAMIHMIQNGELYDYNYVWSPHLQSWTPLGDVQDFSKDRLAYLISNNSEVKRNFFERKFPRVDLKTPVYGHNNHRFFDGETISISENGALILLNDPLLHPGQDIMIHFRESEQNKISFNVSAKIIRKNFTKQRMNVKSGLLYAVRFTEIQEEGKTQLLKWTTNSK